MTGWETLVQRRFWLLLLMEGVERYGIAPIGRFELHRLTFVANSLAPIYDLFPPDPRVLKDPNGPIYPNIQWDLDRLSMERLLELTQFEYLLSDDKTRPTFNACYGLTPAGAQAIADLPQDYDLSILKQFLREICSAIAAFRAGLTVDHLLADVTYRDAIRDRGGMVDFGRDDLNFTTLAAKSLGSIEPPREFSKRDLVHLYIRYLGLESEVIGPIR